MIVAIIITMITVRHPCSDYRLGLGLALGLDLVSGW